MSFGFTEILGLAGSVSQFLANGAKQSAQAQTTQIDKNQFMSLFQEAMQKYGDSSTDAESLAKIPNLFALLDTNQDGMLSKSEFQVLQQALQGMSETTTA
ncbi:MAG: hypothetical protein AB1454_02430 [Candidatus Auribacterota bacterium]